MPVPGSSIFSQAACGDCRLIFQSEEVTIVAANVLSVASNWPSGIVGAGLYRQGHVNSNLASALVVSTNDGDGPNGIAGELVRDFAKDYAIDEASVCWFSRRPLWRIHGKYNVVFNSTLTS